jgi:hypothetical protein
MAALPAATASVQAPAPTTAMLRGAINRRMSVGMSQPRFNSILREAGANASRAAEDIFSALSFSMTA